MAKETQQKTKTGELAEEYWQDTFLPLLRSMIIGSTSNMVELFEPPFNLYTELERLEYEMKCFFPYLSHRNCIELNRAIKSIQKIKNRIVQYEE